jgi:hypothetical protein
VTTSSVISITPGRSPVAEENGGLYRLLASILLVN